MTNHSETPQSEVERMRDEIRDQLCRNDMSVAYFETATEKLAAYEQAIRNEAAGEIERKDRLILDALAMVTKDDREHWRDGILEDGQDGYVTARLKDALSPGLNVPETFFEVKYREALEAQKKAEDSLSELECKYLATLAAPSTGEPAADEYRVDCTKCEWIGSIDDCPSRTPEYFIECPQCDSRDILICRASERPDRGSRTRC